MATLDELERALQSRFDDDLLAVYADALQATGDPRGEVIALERELRSRWDLGLYEQRRDRLFQWLGGEALPGDQPWFPRNFEHGLLTRFDVATTKGKSAIDHLSTLLVSAAGNVIEGLSVSGTPEEIDAIFDRLATHPLPWLRRLTIHRDAKRPIDPARFAAFAAATPNLTELTLFGGQVLASPGHPNVTTLRITGGDSLVIGASPMATVTTLDLAFEDVESFSDRRSEEEHVRLAALVNPRTFPALRVLDLSRSGYRRYSQPPHPVESIPAFLAAVERPGRFDRVVLPAIHDELVPAARGLLGVFPRAVLEISRCYANLDGLEHERIRLPPVSAWREPGTVHGREALSVDIPGVEYGEDLALSRITRELEAQWADMPVYARDAWVAVLDFIADLPWEDDAGNDIEMPFPATTLLLALEAIDGDRRCDILAKMIRDATLAPDAEVRIKHYWGW